MPSAQSAVEPMSVNQIRGGAPASHSGVTATPYYPSEQCCRIRDNRCSNCCDHVPTGTAHPDPCDKPATCHNCLACAGGWGLARRPPWPRPRPRPRGCCCAGGWPGGGWLGGPPPWGCGQSRLMCPGVRQLWQVAGLSHGSGCAVPVGTWSQQLEHRLSRIRQHCSTGWYGVAATPLWAAGAPVVTWLTLQLMGSPADCAEDMDTVFCPQEAGCW